MNLFIFITPLLLARFVRPQDSDVTVCAHLEEKYVRGYLNAKERNTYCLAGCSFLKVTCGLDDDEDPFFTSKDWKNAYDDMMKKMTKLVDNLKIDDMYDEPMDSEKVNTVIDVWTTMFGYSWPVALSIIPVILNQWKYYNFWYATILLLLFIAGGMFGLMSPMISLHNTLIGVLALLHSTNSSFLVESVWTIYFLLAPLFGMFAIDPEYHLPLLVTTIIGYFVYLHWCFFVKRGGFNSGVVVAIAQLLVLGEQLKFARSTFAANSVGGVAIEVCLNSVIPTGQSFMYWKNVVRMSLEITRGITYLPKVPTFFTICGVQIIMFLAFRASLGAFYIHSLRYRTDPSILVSGLFVYAADAFGPVRCAYRIIFRYEQMNPRRIMYAFIGMILNWYEFAYAREFLVLKFFISFLDSTLIRSKYGRTTHYLEYKVDFMQKAFPQDGALPWFDMEVLSNVSAHTAHVVSTNAKATVRGVGVVLNSGGRAMLYCVKHVVHGCQLLKFQSQNIANPEFRPLTNGDDPMVAMKIEDYDGAPEIELLTHSEVFDVAHLVFMNATADDKYICIVHTWKQLSGKLHASVNLRRGDSGGPCFAVLNDGTLRLCGVVSSGNPRRGGGNIISFCYHSGELSADSSEDEKSLGDVAQFNRVRRVKFASDDPEEISSEALSDVHNYLVKFEDEFRELQYWKYHMTWEMMDEDPEMVQHKLSNGNLDDYRDDDDHHYREDGAGDDAGDTGGGKKSKRKDKKARSKDRAYRKRSFNSARVLREKLKLAYSRKDARIIFDTIMKGNIPRMAGRTFIMTTDGRNWIFADNPPNPDWN